MADAPAWLLEVIVSLARDGWLGPPLPRPTRDTDRQKEQGVQTQDLAVSSNAWLSDPGDPTLNPFIEDSIKTLKKFVSLISCNFLTVFFHTSRFKVRYIGR